MNLPGEMILDLCEAKGWTQTMLAQQAGWSVDYARALIRSAIPITEQDAGKLERLLGNTADSWLEADKKYQAAVDSAAVVAEAKEKKLQELLALVPQKARVIVSRLWHNPEITVEYNHVGVRIHQSSEDFIKAVVAEATFATRPTGWRKWFNLHFPEKDQIEKWMLDSLKKIEDEMKEATTGFTP
jgi:plasmid maintenance system antidote protein VapI